MTWAWIVSSTLGLRYVEYASTAFPRDRQRFGDANTNKEGYV